MSRTVWLKSSAFRAILNSPEVTDMVNEVAERVAFNAEGHTAGNGDAIPVDVEPYTTDREAASVVLTHPAGAAMQAKYGVLTTAAAEEGLEVQA